MEICGPLIRPADLFTLALSAGNNNDVTFSPLISALLATSNAAGSTITGLLCSGGNSNGVTVQFTNDNTGQMTIAHDSVASAAGNRIYCPGNSNITVLPRQTVEFFYLQRETHWLVKLVSASGGSVAGSNAQIQFNDSGMFGADADFTWTKATNTLTLGSTTTPAKVIGGSGSGTNGASITVQGGEAGATNTGGAINIVGGTGGSTAGAGGTASLLGGAAVDGVGGGVFVTGAAGVGTNRAGGNVTITSGANTGNAQVGNVVIQPPNATGTGSAGTAWVLGGRAIGSNLGGTTTIQGGAGGSSGGTGGTLNMFGGDGGSNSGQGGVAVFGGGNGQGVDAMGGDVIIKSGRAGSTGLGWAGTVRISGSDGGEAGAGNQTGGSIVLHAGTASGTGSIGTLQLENMTATGTQTATFSATNKPGTGTGAPALWLRVVVSGTTYWIPLFAN